MSADTTTLQVQPEPLGLKKKLLLIRRGLKTVPKRGWNEQDQYAFVRSEDAVGKAHRLLDKYGVLLTPEVDVERELTFQGTTAFVPMLYTFEDVETGEEKVVKWLGAGQDRGDKGTYKAYTGSTKFFLIQHFQIKVGDAPEPETTNVNGQSTSAPTPAAGGTVAKDADRPAATQIPIDRARAILEAAKAAPGLVNDDDSFTAVFKAKLADVGCARTASGALKIGALNVDQAEAVEAFIADETKAAKLQAEAAEKAGS